MLLGQNKTETDEWVHVQTVFPGCATGAGWRAVPALAGRAGSNAQAVGSWDLSCGGLVPMPETEHLQTAFKVLTTQGAAVPNKTNAAGDRALHWVLDSVFSHTEKYSDYFPPLVLTPLKAILGHSRISLHSLF